jgi:putative transposase
MISNNITPILIEALDELSERGLEDLRSAFERIFNELMKMERESILNAAPYERTELRKGYANGFKDKKLITRFGQLDLDVPKTRNIAFYPSCLEKGERSEKALKTVLAEMYIQGVSTRRVKKITEELCGVEFSADQVSRMTKVLDEEIQKFKTRPLDECLYCYFDAHYEKVRHGGHVIDAAVLKAVGVTDTGKREILGLSVDLSEAGIHWKGFLESLVERGLKGVKLSISDDHPGLKAALKSVFPGVPWQRCLFHMSQNAQHYVPKQTMRKEIAQTVREIYYALNIDEATARKEKAIETYAIKAPRFADWLEENFEEGLAFYQFPKEHWRKIRTVNVVERLNEEIRRRTRVARLFPSIESCDRLVTAVVMELHEEWITNRRYL